MTILRELNVSVQDVQGNLSKAMSGGSYKTPADAKQAGEAAEVPIYGPRNVSGTETFSGGSEAVANKMSCLPKAAKNLAETIVDGCIGAW